MDEPKIAFFIDDDQDFLRMIDEAIMHPNFQIKTLHVDNGYHAIDEIIKAKPDVLFIDFYLPRINGSQILPIIKYVQALSGVPVYFVTGFSKEKILPFLEAENYAGILTKSKSLREEVLKILENVGRMAA